MSDEPQKKFGRSAYDPVTAAASDMKLALTEIDASIEWLTRGHLDTAMDRLHLAYRFIGETLAREGRIDKEEPEDDLTG